MNSLKDYRDLFQELNLTELSVTEGDFQLVLKREGQTVSQQSAPIGESSIMTGGDPAGKAPDNSQTGAEKNLEEIKAPLLGIFYGGTEDKPLVQIGERIQKGEVLCSIEAMKMFNEVAAPMDGVIREICVKDGDLVEYNQTLFVVAKQ